MMCPACNGTGLCDTCRGSGTVMDGCDEKGRSDYGGHLCCECFDQMSHRSTGRCRVCGGIGEIMDDFH